MLENELSIEIREVHQCIILELKGDLNQHAAEKLLQLQSWEEGLGQERNNLVLNFTHVQYMNSYGIAVLIRLMRACSKGGCEVFAYGLSRHYAKLLRMVGLTNFLKICSDEEEALIFIEKNA